MAHSLEVRVPLLDHRLVELLARVPDVYKVRPIHRRLVLKPLLRRVAAELLPRDVVHRPKAGFHVPIPAWLKGELRPLLTDTLSSERVRRQGVFDPAAVDALVKAHLDGRRNLSRELWGLMMFGLWYDRHLG
jgi:asparagine synthase (glutamine-hydrolysing)